MEGDAVYFNRRAKEERSAAGNASHATARRAHLDMANRYEELAAAIQAREPQAIEDTLDAA